MACEKLFDIGYLFFLFASILNLLVVIEKGDKLARRKPLMFHEYLDLDSIKNVPQLVELFCDANE